MKKLLILVSLLLVSVLNANAQFSIGAASGGVLGGDTNEYSTLAPGYFGELQFRLILKNEWYVSATPRFESSSYQSKASSPYTFYYFTNSMEFPFHFGHRNALSDKVMLFYDLGPSLHWIMTNDYYGSVYGVELSDKIHPIDLGYVKRFNMDLGATVGVDVWNHMKVFAGFDFGVLPEQRTAFLENFQVSPTHPFSVRLGVGCYFSFKKRNKSK
ncbi:MAG: hypothetical protein IKX60_08685 [Bacteroidales bacterium]|nr:hypothetical protein [Bacteroidales bacterium]